ncbi:hypothetical protein FIBSPDRAFT_874526 [Athelia psychrophila]|uniref:Uncharacterized protein n=1 Tax=Athelia psychrophila TaxID=1759441 RepID=A0A165XEY5_9AGAM|nr:hypothetical protein FIBSPDRAFT_874526 [Fibularhizoctonia sp. CBS 109695]
MNLPLSPCPYIRPAGYQSSRSSPLQYPHVFPSICRDLCLTSNICPFHACEAILRACRSQPRAGEDLSAL